MRHEPVPALLAEVDHPDGLVRFWTGVGTLEYDGHDWTGAGLLAGIGPVNTSTRMQIEQVVFRLAGVTPELIETLGSDVRNRPARAWLADLNDRRRVIATDLIVDGRMDYQELKAQDDGTTMIEVTVEAGLWTLERAVDIAMSKEEQLRRFGDDPRDTGFDLMAELVQKDITWQRT